METGSFIVITTGNPGMRLWTLGDFEPLIVTWSLVQMLPPAFLWVLSASLWTQHCGWRPDLSQCPCLETFLKWEVAGILGSSMGLRVRNLSLTLYLSSSSAQQRCRTVWPWIMVQDLESFSRTNSLFCLSHGRIILDSDQFPWKKKKKKESPGDTSIGVTLFAWRRVERDTRPSSPLSFSLMNSQLLWGCDFRDIKSSRKFLYLLSGFTDFPFFP